MVYGNIKRFQERYPNHPRLGIISVYDPGTDLAANVRFFEESNLPRIVFLNAVSDVNTGYYDRFSEENRRRASEQRIELLRHYLDLKTAGKRVPEFLRAFFDPEFALVVMRPKRDDARPFMTPYTATCVPGLKFSVRADGTLDMCERVNGTLPIGHVDTGPDYAAIKRVIDLYNAGITKHCESCALSKNCTLCCAQCNRHCAFSLPKAWCEQLHARFRLAFAALYSVLEKQPDAFKAMELKSVEDILYYA